jgi:hypothetical protein
MIHALHGLTIGLSAFLLFLVQPLVSKILLPWFGGGSSVWLSALIFFQAFLLAGYAASHWLAKNLPPARLFAAYTALMLLSLFFWPMEVNLLAEGLHPWARIFVLLFFAVGPLYFLLATTTPMVQFWIAADVKSKNRNPYVLYAVSNAGSFAGLLAYPLVIERHFAEPFQRMGWSFGYGLYLVLVAACGIFYLKTARQMQQAETALDDFKSPAPAPPSSSRRIGWMLLALLPVGALMAFTHHVTEEILNLPLLWVVPLCLYLLSFVICFLFPAANRQSPVRTLLLLGAIFLFLVTSHRDIPIPAIFSLAAACLCLFAICLYFHGNLERAKPPKEQLTSFYLYLSLGGCLGGILGGIAAPILLRSNFELPLVLIVAAIAGLTSLPFATTRRAKTFIFAGGALLVAVSYIQNEFGWLTQAEHRARSFYGAYEITAMPAVEGRWVEARLLTMGNTIHGGELVTPDGRYIPMAYYHPDTAAGMALMRFADAENIGVVGLGTGNLALYGRPGQTIDFFEIDPLVIRLATERFGVLDSSLADIRHIVGDARLKLADKPDSHYDLLFLDAFSSGSIPIHLLTLEAVEMYLQKLSPDGIMLFHISNRFADLAPVLVCNAKKLDLVIREHNSAANPVLHQFPSRWVALSKNRQAIQKLSASAPGWKTPDEEALCWTDSFSCLLDVVRFSGRRQ